MNHKLWTQAGARVLAAMFIVAGVAACGDRLDNTAKAPRDASSSSVVIGQAPAPATGDTAQTTTPPGTSDVSKSAESTQRPLEGDNHSYSTLAPTTPQKADGVNRTGKGADSPRSQ